MKQRNSTIYIFFIIFLVSVCCANIPAAENTKNSDQVLYREQIERQEQQLSAVSLIKKANQDFLNKKYESARNQCLKAISILSRISPFDKLTETKIAKAKDLLAMIYTYWADDILKQANNIADSGKLEEAISLCQQAAEINPKLKAHSDKLIDKLKQQIKLDKYKDIKSEFSNNTDFKRKLYNIDVLYEQGKKLYNNQNHTRAKIKFEELLVLDPYNSNAINYLRMINNKMFSAGSARHDVTFNKRAAELEWSQLPPIIAKTFSGNRIDIDSNGAISKKQNIDVLQKKLDDIIIKHIAFEDVPVKTALMFLKRESKRLDLSGKGINIFVRINEKKAIPAIEEKETTETSEKTETSEAGEEAKDEFSDDTDYPVEEITEPYLITIALDNVPLGTAIKYICSAAGLKYTVSDYAVEIYSPDISLGMETLVFPLEKELFMTKQAGQKALTAEQKTQSYTLDLKTFFTERGVQFPEGASAVFDSKISRLIVRNTTSELAKISVIINKLNVPEPQVSIMAKFVELKQTDFDELGFEWRVTSNTSIKEDGLPATISDPINRFALEDYAPATPPPTLDRVFGASYSKDVFRIDQVIHALNQKGRAEVLSAPKVTTLNGQKAVIKMLREAYYPVSWEEPSSTTQSSGIQSTLTIIPPSPTFEDPTPQGILFSVTPFIAADQYTVDLEMQPEIQKFIGWSDYSYTSTYTFATTQTNNTATAAIQENVESTLKMPKFETRTIKTHLRVYDGETVVLGGVLSDDTRTIDDRIPILGDMPLIGRFFRSQVEEAIKINLLIFTTVQLIKPDGTPLRPKADNGMPFFRH